MYDDLLPGERVRLHAAYADALRQGRARGTAAELARHARMAMDLETALAASVQAGDEARAVGGPDEAVEKIQMYDEALGGISRLTFMMNTATVPHARLMEAIDLIGARVAPVVRKELAPA